MQACGVLSCPTGELSRAGKCSRESRDTSVGFSRLAPPAVENCPHTKANRQPGGQPAEVDSRTRMLLEKPIAPTIMRLAIPNAIVMTVQVLIGLLEVYFVYERASMRLPVSRRSSRWFRWWLPSHKARSGAASSRQSHAPLVPAGSALQANMRGTPWRWVFCLASRRQPSWLR